ncbi:MAG: PQQ-dependent sugar dehydrogenase [Gemmatimonadota bacterium]
MRTVRTPHASLLSLVAVGLAGATACAAAAQQDTRTVETDAGRTVVEPLASGLVHPWGMALLPDGRLLVTERAGRLRVWSADAGLSEPVAGIPEVWANGQGGLLDVALAPDFETSRLVYLSYARPGPDGGAATALGRARFEDDRLTGFERIFTEEPWIEGPNHFGGRIVFTDRGTLFLTLGERFQFDPAQDTTNHLGTVVHLQMDGSIPQDNPFVGGAGADAIWSYGHRNIEAAALHPETGELWIAEMGPRGGDELNQPQAGRNYGWPLVSWGRHYDGRDIPDPPTRPELADAAVHWTPVISPSGMAFYRGDAFPAWEGSALIGGLTAEGLVRVTIDGDAATEVERIALGARIRDVEVASDGTLYVLTDQEDGDLWRLAPARGAEAGAGR